MAQININTGTSANDKTGTNWRVAWQSVQSMFTEIYQAIADIPQNTSELNNDSDFVSDADYVHTDNNYDDNEVLALSFIKDTTINYTASIPFTKALTDIATHTMIANITLTANTVEAVDNACTQLLLVNDSSYSADVTAFHVIGEADNTKAYTLLTFERKRGLYLVSIVNFD